MRAVFSFLLAVALALSSVTMAVARGQSAGASVLVVCSGSGPATVTLDATGRPMRAGHACPLCVLPFDAGLPFALSLPRPVARQANLRCGLWQGRCAAQAPVAVARGPPDRV